jgi:hypothetical protein
MTAIGFFQDIEFVKQIQNVSENALQRKKVRVIKLSYLEKGF